MLRKSNKLKFCFVFLFFLFSCNEENDKFELKSQNNSMIWNPESWDSICNFASCTIAPGSRYLLSNNGTSRGAAYLGRAAIYGRATARVTIDGPPAFEDSICTGTLVDDHHLVTSRHCSIMAGCGYGPCTLSTRFRYGSVINGNFIRDTSAALYRLKNLMGASSSCVEDLEAASTDFDFAYWDCNYVSSSYTPSEGYRDIHYYHCPSKPVCGLNIAPGHLYGHFKTGPSIQSSIVSGNGTYGISANYKRNQSVGLRNVLLSPYGEVFNAHPSVPFSFDDGDFGEYYNYFTDMKRDQICGSSGGAVFHYHDPVVYQLLGIVQGATGIADDCHRALYTPGANQNARDIVAYVTSKPFNEYKQYKSDPFLLFGSKYSSITLGGSGGTYKEISCNKINNTSNDTRTKYVAMGIIGTTSSNGNTGNFGLICAPWDAATNTQQIDQAKVVAGGSQGVPFTGYDGNGLNNVTPIDFNTYWNEFLDNELLNGQVRQQNVFACAPGYFLSGVNLRQSSYIHKIESITCRQYNNPAITNSRSLGSNNIAIGTNNLGTQSGADCNNSFIVGAIIHNGAWTDRITFTCQYK